MRQENIKLLEVCFLLNHHLVNLKVLCKDQEEETSNSRRSKKKMEEIFQSLLKQRVLRTQEKALQHHFTVSQMQSEKLQQEVE